MAYELTHLAALDGEATHIMREVAAEFERPVLLFSGGKDSIVLLRLAEKAFWLARFPFPLMHIDTGHNFPEALEYRDRRAEGLGARLIVAKVQDAIDDGRLQEPAGPDKSRNRLQTTVLVDAIAANKLDAAVGGAARDEGRARAATRSAPARRSASSRSATSTASGTRRPSAPSSGTSTTAATARASTCV